jgi:hypothetical protein
MKPRTRLVPGLAVIAALATLLAVAASAPTQASPTSPTSPTSQASPGWPAASSPRPDQFTGNLVNTVRGARFNRTFTLSIDHYDSGAELQQLADTLSAKGQLSLRDQLWKGTAGTLSVGGRLAYPVAAVLSQDTSSGRMIRVVMNRPMSTFEVQNYTRSSKYPFSVLELTIDRNGHGEGRLIGAAKLRMHGNELSFESLGVQPLRLMDVRED